MDKKEQEQRETIADDITARGSKLTGKPPDWVNKLDTLCARCEHSQIMRTKGSRNYTVWCHSFSAYVPPCIEECSSFYKQNEQSLREMTMAAKILDFRDTGGQYL